MLPAEKYDYAAEVREYEEPVREQAVRQARHVNKHVGVGRQILSVLFVLSVATVCLALVGGYERVALAHQENVKLKNEIKKTKTYIEDLTVELEYSMDLHSIEEIASKRLSMDYPKANQLIRVPKPEKPEIADENAEAAAEPAGGTTSEADESFEMPEVEKAFDEADVTVIGLEE